MSIVLDEGPLSRRAGGAPDLYYFSAMPSGGLKAAVGIVHGYADHGARYRHVMEALAGHGIGSIAIDLRGHGRALGRRGYCNRFGEFLGDVDELRRLLDERMSGVPRFLFGHSFGGLVATSSILESADSWQGLFLSAPYFGLALDVPGLKLLAGKVASRVMPTLGIPSGLTGKDLTHDVDRARAYDEDPLVFKNATARWFTEAAGAQDRALEQASRLALPLYIAFGTRDCVASLDAAKRLFTAAGSTDKTWDERRDLFHELLNEPSWKEVLDDVARWVLTRV